MDRFLFSYWWLVFPLASFAFGGLHAVLRWKMERDRIDVLKAYAAQGKEPPVAFLNAMNRC